MNRIAAAIISVAIVGGSGAGAFAIYGAREQPKKSQRTELGVAVETVRVSSRSHRLDVRASGMVVPARELDVVPLISGRVRWLYRGLLPGTFVEARQTLFRLDSSDYRVALSRARANLRVARSQLALERGQQKIARGEWDLLRDAGAAGSADDPSLALRKPQLDAAKGNVAVAESNVAEARLALSRTSFAAEFPAVIVESNAEVGQLATPQTLLAKLVGTESFHVRVAVPHEHLSEVELPGMDGEGGSEVVVQQRVGERTVERTGRVIRLLSNLEPSSRMTRLLVEIDDPFGLDGAEGDAGGARERIILDNHVQVIIRGKRDRELVEIARKAVRDGNVAYVYDPERQQLEVRQLTIAWRLPDSVLVERGLKDGDHVITSPLSGAVPGLKLREVTRPEASAAAETETPTDG